MDALPHRRRHQRHRLARHAHRHIGAEPPTEYRHNMNATDLLETQPTAISQQLSAIGVGVSVVIPLLNEAESLLPLYQEINATLAELALPGSAEIIFVDDGSTDGSL